MTAEEKVRGARRDIGVYDYGGSTRYVYLASICKEFCAANESAAWEAALAFTEERQRQIAEVEEEIAWLVDGMAVSGDPEPIGERILAREQAALADLQRGMRT